MYKRLVPGRHVHHLDGYIRDRPRVAFAAKDAARIEHELSQAGVSYEAGEGITIEDRVISADVTMQTIDGVRADTIPLAFIEAL